MTPEKMKKLLDEEINGLTISKLKWKEIIAYGGCDQGHFNCALCVDYNTAIKQCVGCPINNVTGKKYCEGSPYEEWCNHFESKHKNFIKKILCEECEVIAKKELDFLESLV